MTAPVYTDQHLDTLREVANIGAGTASTALAGLLGRPVDISIPVANALPLADGIAGLGTPGARVTGVLVPVAGDIPALVLAVFASEGAAGLCELLGVAGEGELGLSALAEASNILATHYLGSLNAMTGLALEPEPPQLTHELPADVLHSAVAVRLGAAELVLFIGTELRVEGGSCALSFLFVPGAAAAAELLSRLGVPL
ncbi:MAG TPA: chemotaxis protein CheC [Solirubrobacteraceae bacterium]|jgi:chemotaxis protein CheC